MYLIEHVESTESFQIWEEVKEERKKKKIPVFVMTGALRKDLERIKGPFTPEEDYTIVGTHTKFGNKWATIDNAIKKHWSFALKWKCPHPQASKSSRRSTPPTAALPFPSLPASASTPTAPFGADVSNSIRHQVLLLLPSPATPSAIKSCYTLDELEILAKVRRD